MTNPAGDSLSSTAAVSILVDHRERSSGLLDALRPLWSALGVGNLVVGDVRVGSRVCVERKTVHDLVRSIADGRLYRQMYALCGETVRPLLVIEGADAIPAAGLSAESVRGVLLSVAVGYRVPMLRTMDVHETAVYIAAIASREQRRLKRGGRRRRERPGPLSVLAAVPGVGDDRAAALLAEFGSLARVFTADVDALARVPMVGPATARRIHSVGRQDAHGRGAAASADPEAPPASGNSSPSPSAQRQLQGRRAPS